MDKHTVLKIPRKYLHILARSGDYKLLKEFLNHKTSDPSIEDFEGNTLLHYAMHVTEFGKYKNHVLDGNGDHHPVTLDGNGDNSPRVPTISRGAAQ